MAIGFPASHSVTRAIQNDDHRYAQLVEQAFSSLGWQIIERSQDVFTASVPLSPLSWGERLKVTFGGGQATITSACYPFQIIDWGKNRRNVETFVTALMDAERSAATLYKNDPARLYEKGESVVDMLVRDQEPDKV